MEILLDNWYILVGAISLIALAFGAVVTFLGHPTSKQIEKIKTWLLQAVLMAEKELGKSTGEAKLALVYDKFIERFPWMSKIISLKKFERLVDMALNEMKSLMETTPEYDEYVHNKDKEDK